MNGVLVDSSAWIGFFRGQEDARPLLTLLERGLVLVNDLILAELLPTFHHRKEPRPVVLLGSIENLPLAIDWPALVRMQTANLASGLNRVGIPDLLIAQQALQVGVCVFSLDRHFALLAPLHGFRLFPG
jgi:hypothetical protein